MRRVWYQVENPSSHRNDWFLPSFGGILRYRSAVYHHCSTTRKTMGWYMTYQHLVVSVQKNWKSEQLPLPDVVSGKPSPIEGDQSAKVGHVSDLTVQSPVGLLQKWAIPLKKKNGKEKSGILRVLCFQTSQCSSIKSLKSLKSFKSLVL